MTLLSKIRNDWRGVGLCSLPFFFAILLLWHSPVGPDSYIWGLLSEPNYPFNALLLSLYRHADLSALRLVGIAQFSLILFLVGYRLDGTTRQLSYVAFILIPVYFLEKEFFRFGPETTWLCLVLIAVDTISTKRWTKVRWTVMVILAVFLVGSFSDVASLLLRHNVFSEPWISKHFVKLPFPNSNYLRGPGFAFAIRAFQLQLSAETLAYSLVFLCTVVRLMVSGNVSVLSCGFTAFAFLFQQPAYLLIPMVEGAEWLWESKLKELSISLRPNLIALMNFTASFSLLFWGQGYCADFTGLQPVGAETFIQELGLKGPVFIPEEWQGLFLFGDRSVRRDLVPISDAEILVLPSQGVPTGTWVPIFENNLASIFVKGKTWQSYRQRILRYYEDRGIPFQPARGFSLSDAFWKNKNWVLAHEEILEPGLWLKPTVSDRYVKQTAQFYARESLSPISIALLKSATDADPDDMSLQLSLAELLVINQQYAEAKALLAKIPLTTENSRALAMMRNQMNRKKN